MRPPSPNIWASLSNWFQLDTTPAPNCPHRGFDQPAPHQSETRRERWRVRRVGAWRAKTIFTFGNVVESIFFPCCCSIHKSYVHYMQCTLYTFYHLKDRYESFSPRSCTYSLLHWPISSPYRRIFDQLIHCNNFLSMSEKPTFVLLLLLLSHSQHHRSISFVNHCTDQYFWSTNAQTNLFGQSLHRSKITLSNLGNPDEPVKSHSASILSTSISGLR